MTSLGHLVRPGWHILAALGVVELALLATLGWWPGAELPWPGLLIFAGAFVVYVLAAVCVAHAPSGDRTIWSVAVAMRLAMLPLTPELSDDVYRYLWDGHVQLSGVNPYLHAPDAEEVVELRTAYHHQINNPDVPTIYPPLAQLAFVLITLAGGTIVSAKLLWLAFDIGTGWLLGRVARATDRSHRLTKLLYLWSPLLVVEVAWSAHLETLGLFALALTILPAGRRPVGSGVALALAALTKFAPAAALPAMVRRHGWRLFAAFAATSLLLYVPYLGAGADLFTGLRTYGEHWWFMKGPFAVLEALFEDPVNARRSAGALVLGVVAWTVVKRYDPERALFWVLGSGMILTPTLHPWYVLWMLPMAALRASRPWILLSGLAFIGYFGLGAYQETGVWPQPALARAGLWLPFLGLMVYEALERRRRVLQAQTEVAG
jgi:hypothetical protein